MDTDGIYAKPEWRGAVRSFSIYILNSSSGALLVNSTQIVASPLGELSIRRETNYVTSSLLT